MTELFQTTNRALAVTLITCGVPFAPDASGKPVPFINVYDVPLLRSFVDEANRPIYAGMTPIEAARAAWRDGRPGKITFSFVRTEILERIVEAYDAHSALIKKADSGAMPQEISSQVSASFPQLEPEQVAVICCQFIKNRNAVEKGWRTATPYISFPGPMKQQTEADGRRFNVGSFKLVSLNASEKTQKAVGLY